MSTKQVVSLPHDVIILGIADCLPQGLPVALQNAGGSSRYVSTPEEIVDQLEDLFNPIVIIEIGTQEEQAIKVLRKFIKSEELLSLPLLLVGESVDGFESILTKYFSHHAAIQTPQKVEEAMNALEYLSQTYTPKHIPSQSLERDTEIKIDSQLDFGESIPQQVFNHLDEMGKSEKQLAGKELKAKLTIDHLSKMNLLPTDEKLRKATEEVYEQLKHWPREHVCRVTYICDRFNEILEIPENEREDARNAALLFPWSFANTTGSLLRKNYLIGSESVKKDLGHKLKDSAMKVMGDLENPRVGKIIGDMAKLIMEEVSPNNEDISVATSSLVAANLIDRICFQSGYWNPKGAHFLLKEAKTGGITIVHELVLACVVKFLSEGIAHLPRVFVVPSKFRDDPELQKMKEENESYVPEENERKVSIDSLEPGMRLSKPVVAYDGRKILSEEVILDQDLIWRLWQLSAVRPMNTPVVVEQEK